MSFVRHGLLYIITGFFGLGIAVNASAKLTVSESTSTDGKFIVDTGTPFHGDLYERKSGGYGWTKKNYPSAGGGSNTRRFSVTLTQSGTYEYKAYGCYRGCSWTSQESVTVQLNKPPGLGYLPSGTQTVNEDSGQKSYSFVVTDQHSHGNQITVSASSSNHSVVSSSNVSASITSANAPPQWSGGTLYVTPNDNASGATTITITATDPQGASTSSSFNLQVNAIDDAPYFTTRIADQNIFQNGITASLRSDFDDIDTSSSSLSASATVISNSSLLSSDGISISGSHGTRYITVKPNQGVTGEGTIRVTVSDGHSSVTDDFQVTVKPIPKSEPLSPVSKAYPNTYVEDHKTSGVAVGTLPGSVDVGASGAATYSIPLSVPKGVGDHTPSVALIYNSGGGNGIMGVGWSLSTGSVAIKRCPQNEMFDRQSVAMNASATDRFCVGGDRLHLTSGSYGAPGSVYALENDTSGRYEVVGGSAGHPNYFTYTSKKGEVIYFGYDANSRLSHHSGLTTLQWALSHRYDLSDNQIRYVYSNSGNTLLLNEIRYAKSGDLELSYIDFHYENRPDRNTRYFIGTRLVRDKRLSGISVVNEGRNVKTYQIEYADVSAQVNKRSRVTSIRECAGNLCLPASQFEWTDNPLGYGEQVAEINTGYLSQWQLADIDRDGIDDLIYSVADDSNSANRKVMRRMGTIAGFGPATELSSRNFDSLASAEAPIELLDVNGDGQFDIYHNDSSSRHKLMSRFTGSRWEYDSVTSGAMRADYQHKEYIYADINGDGIVDWIKYGPSKSNPVNDQASPREKKRARYIDSLEVHLGLPIHSNNEARFADPYAVTLPSSYQSSTGLQYRSKKYFTGDFDGDGVSELVLATLSGKDAVLDIPNSAGQATIIQRDFSILKSVHVDDILDRANRAIPVDIDRDGITDIVEVTCDDDYCNYWALSYRIMGSNNSEPVELGIDPQLDAGAFSVNDYDMDGNPDIWLYGVPIYVWRNDRYEAFTPSNMPYGIDKSNSRNGILGMKSSIKKAKLDRSNSHYLVKEVSRVNVVREGSKYKAYPNGGKLHIFKSRNSEAFQKIKIFTNGLGAREEVDYEDISVSTHYKAAGDTRSRATPIKDNLCLNTISSSGCTSIYSGGIASSGELKQQLQKGGVQPPNAETQASPYKRADVTKGSTIVTKVRRHKPVENGPGSMKMHASETRFFYARARMQTNVGQLGFESIVQQDVDTGFETQTVFRQDYPFHGQAYFTERRRMDTGNVLSARLEELALKTSDIPRLMYIKNSTEVAYHENTGQPLKEVVITTEIDHWNNVSAKRSVTKGQNNETRTIEITTSFANETDRSLGRVQKTDTITTLSNSHGTDEHLQRTEYTYTNNGLLRTIINAGFDESLKSTTTYNHDSAGNIIEEILSAANLVTRSAFTDYDDDKRYVIKVRNALGHTTSKIIARNGLGQVTESTGANAERQYVYYNALGQQTGTRNNVGTWAKTRKDSCQNVGCMSYASYVLTQEDVSGAWQKSYVDAWGRTLRTEAPSMDGRVVRTEVSYYKNELVAYSSNPYFVGDTDLYTSHAYADPLLRLTGREAPGRSLETISYDGFTTLKTNGLGQTRKETVNALGQLILIEDTLGGKQSFQYDAQGNLRFSISHGAASDPHNIVTEIRYDALGRKIYMNDPDKGLSTYTYNPIGEMKSSTDAKGQTQRFEYDVLGRMIKRDDYSSSNALLNHTRWYFDGASPYANAIPDAIGKPTGVAHSRSQSDELCYEETTEYCAITLYDIYGRPASTFTVLGENEFYGAYTSEIVYDTKGRVSETRDAMSAVTGASGTRNVYNDLGVNTAVVDIHSGKTLYQIKAMNARGQVTEALHGNGVTQQFRYNTKTGLIEKQFADASGIGPVQDIAYRWDTNTNLTYRYNTSGITNANAGLYKHSVEETFCYDDLNRLIKVLGGDNDCAVVHSESQGVKYNSLGNITYRSGMGNYTYGNNAGPHAVTHTGGNNTRYRYDSKGNLISDNTRNLTYSIFDKPITITNSTSQATTTFRYGPSRGRWLREDTKGGVTTTTLTIGNVERITKSDSADITWRRYASDAATFVVTTDGGYALQSTQERYLFKDHLGSGDVITDNTGQVIESMSFDAWGVRRRPWDAANYDINTLLNYSAKTTTRGYTGHEMLDEVGLIHMNGRVYDPKLARFISADILVPDPMDTQSYNRYSYVRNRPLVKTDPSGFSDADKQLDEAATERQEREQARTKPEEVKVIGSSHCDTDACRERKAEEVIAERIAHVNAVLSELINISSNGDTVVVDIKIGDQTFRAVGINGQALVGTTRQIRKFFRRLGAGKGASRELRRFMKGGGLLAVTVEKTGTYKFSGSESQGGRPSMHEALFRGGHDTLLVAQQLYPGDVEKQTELAMGLALAYAEGGLAPFLTFVGGITVTKSVTRFKHGELFEHTIKTKQGPVDLLAETVIKDKTLILKDVAVFGRKGNEALTGLQKDIFRGAAQLKDFARQQGFKRLEIKGTRIEGSSSARPGHDVNLGWDL